MGHAMNKPSTSKTSRRPSPSRTDWPRVKAMRDAEIDLSDIPEITSGHAADGVLRVAGNVVPRGKKRTTGTQSGNARALARKASRVPRTR